MGKDPTPSQVNELNAKRIRLQKQISKFQEEARKRLPADIITESTFVDMDLGEWDDLDDDDMDADSPEVFQLPPGSENLPEYLPISLPSTVTPATPDDDDSVDSETPEDNFEALCAKERKLRIGQANDALHRLRLAIANRSVMMRTGVRSNKSQAAATRAWRQVHSLTESVSRAARIYRLARKSLVRLEAPPEIMQQYRTLTHADLKAETTKLDFNALGSRNIGASWLWGMHEAPTTNTELLAGE